MKRITILSAIAALAFMALGCSKDSEGVTRITYYPTLEVLGDNPAVIASGGSYTDPGYVATLNGEDVSADVTVSSDVDMNKVGIYSVTYTIVNADGISASASRTVIVVNPITSIENVYAVTCRNGARTYTNPMLISEKRPGVYHIPDWLGGFYCLGIYPGYEASGFDFWAEADFSINSDNTISLVSYDSGWYFAASFDETPTSSSYDPATGVISWTIHRGNLFVTLTPYTVD